MNFRKTVIALTAAGALGLGTIGATQPASAVTPAWVIPVIIVAGVGGVALGAAADNAYAYGPPSHAGVVTAQPVAGCWIENRRSGPVQVCRR
ncbi:MAG: hypothetical protein K2P86_08910 [Xanthobacteraceae bacterium]|nr:hypothetical protein [Xanthobacteraceae bacterium]